MKIFKRNEESSQPPMNLHDFRNAMNRFFEQSIVDPFSSFFGSRFPSWENQALGSMIDVDVSEDEKNITIEVDIPGYAPENVEVFVDKDLLIIKGKMEEEKEEKNKKYYRKERRSGEFYREIPLPTSVDATKTTCKDTNGVLTITMPKIESKDRKKIPIET